jgi:S-adenosylmethionine decarboxylase
MPVGDPGEEWIVDALGCAAEALRDACLLKRVFAQIVSDVGLHALTDAFWHVFPGAAGVTGLLPLKESHLAVHTYPEFGVATFNLYCCRSGCAWPWETRLRDALGAREVVVRRVTRGRQVAREE